MSKNVNLVEVDKVRMVDRDIVRRRVADGPVK